MLELALKLLSYSVAFVGSNDSDITGYRTGQHLKNIPVTQSLLECLFGDGPEIRTSEKTSIKSPNRRTIKTGRRKRDPKKFVVREGSLKDVGRE
jgi:hypothetical protein